MKLLLLLVLSLLAGCMSSPARITGSSPDGAQAAPLLAAAANNPTIHDDLIAANNNLQNAIKVNAIPAEDPAAACMEKVLIEAGITQVPGTTPPASFLPENKGLASAGVIAYIVARQLEETIASAAAFKPSTSCLAVLGQVVVDGAKAVRAGVRTVIPGLRLLP